MKNPRNDTGPGALQLGAEPESGASLPWWAWLDAAPAAWLLVVISAYGVLAFYPLVNTKAPVAGITAADPLALPFLVLTLTAGIIRYFYARKTEPQTPSAPAPACSARRDTS